jgi:hypothetical protein
MSPRIAVALPMAALVFRSRSDPKSALALRALVHFGGAGGRREHERAVAAVLLALGVAGGAALLIAPDSLRQIHADCTPTGSY